MPTRSRASSRTKLGHIALGHSITRSENASKAGNITILSLLLGLAAVAAGAGEAGLGIIGAGQQAALGNFLAHTRGEESGADVARGQISLPGRADRQGFRSTSSRSCRIWSSASRSRRRTAIIARTRSRASAFRCCRKSTRTTPAYDRPLDPALEARFQRVKAKLVGYVAEPTQTLRNYPESDQSVPRALCPRLCLAQERLSRKGTGRNPLAARRFSGRSLFPGNLRADPARIGQAEGGAIAPLQKAVASTNAQSLIAGVYGHALIASEDPAYLPEAERVLKAAVARDAANPFAWYQLGVVYANRGDTARAALASAERYVLQGNAPLALQSAEQAMTSLPQGSADWIRAQDIAILARDAVERQRRRR
jgi:hypothetical protein